MLTRQDQAPADGTSAPAPRAGLLPVRAVALLIDAGGFQSNPGFEATACAALQKLVAALPASRCYGVVAIASAQELEFARACLSARLPLKLFLPTVPEGLPALLPDCDAAQLRQVVGGACHISIIPGGTDGLSGLHDCRLAVLMEEPLLLDFGGCQTAADEEHRDRLPSRGLTVAKVDAPTGDVTAGGEKALGAVDPELGFLAAQVGPPSSPAKVDPHTQAREWFQRLDAKATAVAPNLRRLATAPVLLTATAAVLSVANLLLLGSWLIPIFSMALGLVAFWVPRLIKTRNKQTEWVRLRVAAEFCRSHLALWPTGAATDPMQIEAAPELAGMLRALDLLKLTANQAPPEIGAFKAHYSKERIRNQMAYFRLHHRRGQRLMKRYSRLASLGVLGGMWVNLASFVVAVSPTTGWFEKPMAVGILAPICFQVAAVASALIAVNDLRRRIKRYAELQEKLTTCERALHASQTWASVLAIAHRVERLLLTEVLEFRALYRHASILH